MRFFGILIFLCFAAVAFALDITLSETQQKFRAELAAKFQELEKKNVAACAGVDGWIFFGREFRILSLSQFWGAEAGKTSRAQKPDLADPIPAIVDFQKQLSARGVELLLVPIPPKAAIYPEKIAPETNIGGEDTAPFLHRFYDELRAAGVDVLDLTPIFLRDKESAQGPIFCKTDTHFSGVGCVRAAEAMAQRIRQKILTLPRGKEYASEWKPAEFTGDLVNINRVGGIQSAPEKLRVRQVVEKSSEAAVQADANSPVLLLGDSHALVFHDFLAERSGLLDQLAYELGFAPDVIGIRGSGSTPLRVTLYRRNAKEPDYLSKKKIVIWCFAAREFTESEQGWAKMPVAK
jgi:alginate O-acetyltransferase complex protein AlgJ